uniref:Uncharacterized protein n=1 Tax=Stomoxys calcitrans TaxID=35570 RepID=A0A1I8PXL3_STOCA
MKFLQFLIVFGVCLFTWADVSHISRRYLPVVSNDGIEDDQLDERTLSHHQDQQYYNNNYNYQQYQPNYPYGSSVYGAGYYPQYFTPSVGGGGGGYYGSSGYQGQYQSNAGIYGGIGLGLGAQVAKPFSLEARGHLGGVRGTVIQTKDGYIYNKKK